MTTTSTETNRYEETIDAISNGQRYDVADLDGLTDEELDELKKIIKTAGLQVVENKVSLHVAGAKTVAISDYGIELQNTLNDASEAIRTAKPMLRHIHQGLDIGVTQAFVASKQELEDAFTKDSLIKIFGEDLVTKTGLDELELDSDIKMYLQNTWKNEVLASLKRNEDLRLHAEQAVENFFSAFTGMIDRASSFETQ